MKAKKQHAENTGQMISFDTWHSVLEEAVLDMESSKKELRDS